MVVDRRLMVLALVSMVILLVADICSFSALIESSIASILLSKSCSSVCVFICLLCLGLVKSASTSIASMRFCWLRSSVDRSIILVWRVWIELEIAEEL